MAGRQHEAVAVRPARVGGVEFQEAGPERGGDVGHAHRQAGMAGFGGLDGVDGECPDGVGHAAGWGDRAGQDGGLRCERGVLVLKLGWAGHWDPSGFSRVRGYRGRSPEGQVLWQVAGDWGSSGAGWCVGLRVWRQAAAR